jgi:hypothetical protein
MNGYNVSAVVSTFPSKLTNMKKCVAIFLCCFQVALFFHKAHSQTVSSVDIVKVNARYNNEAYFFYNENWLAFRKLALEKKLISNYEMMKIPTDSGGHYTLILITQYPDSLYYQNREINFDPIMRSISPNGPKMLNSIDRKELLQYVDGFDATTIVSGKKS